MFMTLKMEKKLKTLFNKVKEIEYVKFTHHNEAILCATKKDCSLN